MNKDYLELTVPGVRGLKPYQPGKPITELEREYGVSDDLRAAGRFLEHLHSAHDILGLVPNSYDDRQAWKLFRSISGYV